jgi:2',3'-cyclic-nucleotide 2'-phosphodiesterase (5'-nucleotidase family)
MSPRGAVLPRRALLGAPVLLAPPARADAPFTGADLLLVVLADLHSAGERAAAALGAVDAALAANRRAEALVVLNGDVFERGNAVALRSGGVADWAFLAALRRRAPVVLNLGNHEAALLDDMAEVVRRAAALDLIVLSTLRDRRTGRELAPASATLPLRGGRALRLVGLATAEAATYRAAARDTLEMPDPVEWGRANLPGLLAGADAAVVLSHAGIAADRDLLPLLPDGALLVGGHEHLRLLHAEGATRLVHPGSWNRFVVLAGLGFTPGGPRLSIRQVAVEPGVAEDPRHAATWREVLGDHAAPEDREVVLRLPRALPLAEGARRAAAAIGTATGAAFGVVNHTNFGTGLPGGEVTRLAWDAFLRFDGPLVRGSADRDAVEAMTPRLNQDAELPLAARIGDFAYAAPPPAPGALGATGWVRMNTARYLGGPVAFQPVAGVMLKEAVAAALRASP